MPSIHSKHIEHMEYKLGKYFSTYDFYKMIGEFNNYLLIYKPKRIVLDFSEVTRLEALVIPNLLFLGKYIKSKTGYIPYIRLGESLKAGYLKKYLLGINFYKISDEFYYYENDRFAGLEGKTMDPKNTTAYFKIKDGVEEAQRRIFYGLCPFVFKYLSKFNTYRYNNEEVLDAQIFGNNTISKFMEELIMNSFEHGESDAIITVQANYKKRKLFVSTSDDGTGFLHSVLAKKNWDTYGNEDDNEEVYNVLGRPPRTELEGIFFGIYKRKYSRLYGLYNVIRITLESQGLVRIHSNDVQLIVSSQLLREFYSEEILDYQKLKKHNIVKTGNFPGVHIEIEIPF